MKIKSLVRPMFFLGIIIVFLGFCCSSTMIWGQLANSLPVSDDYTGFISSMICIPIPILLMGGVVLVFYLIIRKPKFADKCLWHVWNGCKCSLCGLEDHNWNRCICLKCGEVRSLEDKGSHDLSGCVCTKCGTAFHESGWIYKTADACDQILRCSRCGLALEERVFHHPKKEQAATNACTQLKRCTRCSSILKEIIEHKFKDASGLRKSPCHFIQKCQRCGETKERYEHEFEFVKTLSHSSNPEVHTQSWTDLQKCKRCGVEETKSDWAYTDW